MAHVVVDPVSRIEEHLRIEAEVEGGKITIVHSSCTLCQGLEKVLVGRDPRDAWAFTQRICGVCAVVHACASVRAVEDALGIEIPPLAQAFRNLLIASQNVRDHAMHFYQLHAMDWVNVPSALRADPQKTSELARSLSQWPNSSAAYFKDVLAKLEHYAPAGRSGLFGNAYWDHPAYRLSPELNLLVVAHSLEALDWQRDVVRIQTLLGGPGPHPDFLVGGVPFSVGATPPAAVNAVNLAEIGSCVGRIHAFVEQVYVPDLLAVAGSYVEWFSLGAGQGNLLSSGELPVGRTRDASGFFLPRGAILGRNLSEVLDVDPDDPREVEEAPAQARLASPRWKGNPMEVGPLARMLVAYARGHAGVKEKVDAVLGRFRVKPDALFSTLGRNAARGIEAWLLAEHLGTLHRRITALVESGRSETFQPARWDPKSWPASCHGVGRLEAPRGSLVHRAAIRNQKIERYEIVVPSTWNAGPADATGHPGPFEAALAGTPVHDPKEPVEILRTVHSFDPCLACACHVVGARGETLAEVKAR